MSNDYSQTALNRFLDHLDKTNHYNKETLRSRKTAVNRLLSVLDDEERLDLSKVDVEQLAKRYGHQSGAHSRTLQDYQQRFKSVRSDFIAWTEDPTNFKPAMQPRAPRRHSSKGSTDKVEKKAKRQSANTDSASQSGQSILENDNTLPIPVSLRPGLVIKVNLPPDLTAAEAERLAGIIKAHAMPT